MRGLGMVLSLALLAPVSMVLAGEKLEGYAEYRDGDILVIEGQRVVVLAKTRFDGGSVARSFASIPLGSEVKVEGSRRKDGVLVARKVEVERNGSGLFESDLSRSFDQIEAEWRRRGEVFEESNGRTYVVGDLLERGPDVVRARRIAESLVPPYLPPTTFRVYVVDNPAWNAMAAPNGSVYVFRGLLDDMDDDEVAIIVGHELVHVTHEHSRKQAKQSIWAQIGLAGGRGAAEAAMGRGGGSMIGDLASLSTSAWMNGHSRGQEDQADRVGLRYAYAAGYDVTKGPELWLRFARKYGSGNKTKNFFFGDHSVALDRARNLDREVKLNYQQ